MAKIWVYGILFLSLSLNLLLGWWLLDLGGAANRYREQVERLTKDLDRNQRRVVHVIREVETVRTGINYSVGELGKVEEGLQGIRDILGVIRTQRLD